MAKVALCAQKIEVSRQDLKHPFRSFLTVMKHNDGTCTGVSLQFFQGLVRVNVRIKVSTQQIPHYEEIPLFQGFALCSGDPAIRRSKQNRLKTISSFQTASEVASNRGFPAVLMVPCMTSQGMSFRNQAAKQQRSLLHIGSDAEKGRFRTVRCQQVQNPLGNPRCWSVIKGHIDRLLRRMQTPHETTGQGFHERRCLAQVHASKIRLFIESNVPTQLNTVASFYLYCKE